jgi:prepilin-type N-terminal cleavage/methylation domain-containing protein
MIMAGRRRAFSLLELVVVLALIGLLGGVALVGVGRSGARFEQDDAIRAVEQRLLEARAAAMTQARPTAVDVGFGDGQIILQGFAGRSAVPSGGLVSVGASGEAVERLLVRFAADGRASTLGWRLVGPGVDLQRAFDLGLLDESRLLQHQEAAADGIGGRLWWIRFDPVSGAPAVRGVTPE